jgi:2',3'-cyclic-nucleotide 2'-phosphodiesterase
MKLLFIGDVMGEPGLRAVRAQVPRLREHYALDLVIANAENVAGGNGVTKETAEALFSAGVDVLSNGNHAWDKREALEYIRTEPRLLRPYNYPDGTPGEGWLVATTKGGHNVGVLNLMGLTFMEPKLSCAFRAADHALLRKPPDVKLVFVDIHAETTSEKMALAWYLDGRVSAVIGTHTHVPTADERILPKGTGFLTDVGMSGCYDSVIGLKVEQSLERFVNKLPARFEVAQGEGTLCAVLLDLDEVTGRCRHIERVRLNENEISAPSLRRVV